jgi:hypothetical protein
MTLWLPFFLLAVIPAKITLGASLPFDVNFVSAIVPLFGVAAYLAYSKYGLTGLVSVASLFLLGLFIQLLNWIATMPSAAKNPPVVPPDKFDRIEGSGAELARKCELS